MTNSKKQGEPRESVYDDIDKLYWEVEKLKEETKQLKRPFFRDPRAFVALVSALAAFLGVSGAIAQYSKAQRDRQLAQIQIERTELELQKLNKEKNKLENNIRNREAELREKQNTITSIDTRLRELKSRLDDITLAQAKSELKIIIAQVEGSLNDFIAANESSSIENMVALAKLKRQEEPEPKAAPSHVELRNLIQDMNSADRTARLSATGRLTNQYADNPEAVKLVLEFYDPNKIDSLSASGRINALHFLTNTTHGAWNPDTIEKAKKALELVEKRHETGKAYIGPQTRKYINDFKRHLESISTPVS